LPLDPNPSCFSAPSSFEADEAVLPSLDVSLVIVVGVVEDWRLIVVVCRRGGGVTEDSFCGGGGVEEDDD
jgi:hypothetical protein